MPIVNSTRVDCATFDSLAACLFRAVTPQSVAPFQFPAVVAIDFHTDQLG